ncbi:hypothetical protein PInf_025060 [Phytophthora infestans]|nr:hypothetical protein PInf_025060 [Phytophthora infestans]
MLLTPVISSRTPSVRGSAKKAAKGQRLVKPKFDFYLVRGKDERIQRDLSRTIKLADEQGKVSTSRSSATTGFSPLLWLGGKAAKHSTSAKSRQDAPEDLFVLLNRDSKRYERVIARTTSKFDIDED